jgi:hypothetical protein
VVLRECLALISDTLQARSECYCTSFYLLAARVDVSIALKALRETAVGVLGQVHRELHTVRQRQTPVLDREFQPL